MNSNLGVEVRNTKANSLLGILSLSVLFLAILAIAFFIKRADSVLLIGTFLVAFGSYMVLFLKKEKIQISVKTGIVVGVLIRFILVFALPNLSDDFYRFIWD